MYFKTILVALLLCGACSTSSPVPQSKEQPEKRNTTNFITVPMNDPLLPYQKYLYESGIVKAWQLSTGNRQLKIAIIDGEVRQHSDLQLLQTKLYSLDAPSDHATPIAGIIGATQNNGLGMAGIAQCQLLSYVAQTRLDPKLGDFLLSAVTRSFYQAAADGAKIINCSFGVRQDLPEIRAAVDYVIQRGVTVIASASNDGKDWKTYPAAYPTVIGVGGSYEGRRADWSNYGEWVTIYAPGQGLLTETPEGTTLISGTSASAPIVTGTVALMLSVNPKLKPMKIKKIIQQTSKTGQLDSYQAVLKAR